MATNTLAENITRAIIDFGDIKTAIINKGVAVPNGTPTSEYPSKIGSIQTGITPQGTISINSNGNYDVTNFAQADVNADTSTELFIRVLTTGDGYEDFNSEEAIDCVIPYGVIELRAQLNKLNLRSIIMPDSVTLFDSYCENNPNLESVVFSKNITALCEGVFRNCPKLMVFRIPHGVINLQDQAFALYFTTVYGTTFYIPDTVEYIGNQVTDRRLDHILFLEFSEEEWKRRVNDPETYGNGFGELHVNAASITYNYSFDDNQ